jgi:hypothetical protein
LPFILIILYFKALSNLRGYQAQSHQLVQYEMNMLADEKKKLSQQKKVGWMDFFKVRTLLRPLIVAVCVHISQQLSGINAVRDTVNKAIL